MSRQLESALAECLADMFSPMELRSFLRHNGFREVVDTIRDADGAPRREYAARVAEALEDRDVVKDPLFEALREARPHRSRAIHRLQQEAASQAPIYETLRLRPLRAVPDYPDENSKVLARQLEQAYKRKAALEEVRRDASAVVQEILSLKRRLREGGQLKAGDLLSGRYLLLRKIGWGGFGTVWEALDRTTGTAVAVKVLHTQLCAEGQRLERFFRGARAMAQLQHEAVVRVQEACGEDNGYYYFVMELVHGGNLHEAVLQGRWRTRKDKGVGLLRSLILPIGEVLCEAHGSGFVHRDVKPQNVLLTAEGQPKLTDFDLVHGEDTTGGTRTGAMGSVLYSAPELLDRPQDADARADVFGLGMTAIFVLYGKKLPNSVLRDAESIIAKLPSSQEIKGALKRAVQWEASRRFDSIAGFRDALSEAMATSYSTAQSALLHEDRELFSAQTKLTVEDTYRFTQLRRIHDGTRGNTHDRRLPSSSPIRIMLVLVKPAGVDKDKGVQIDVPRYLVGHEESADLVIHDDAVSRRHARLVRQSDQTWWIEDLCSTNGTFVNSQKIERRRLDDGDLVQFSNNVFRVVLR